MAVDHYEAKFEIYGLGLGVMGAAASIVFSGKKKEIESFLELIF